MESKLQLIQSRELNLFNTNNQSDGYNIDNYQSIISQEHTISSLQQDKSHLVELFEALEYNANQLALYSYDEPKNDAEKSFNDHKIKFYGDSVKEIKKEIKRLENDPKEIAPKLCSLNNKKGIHGRYFQKDMGTYRYLTEPNKIPMEIPINCLIKGEDKFSIRKDIVDDIYQNGFNVYASIQVFDNGNGTYTVHDGHNRLGSMESIEAESIPCYIFKKGDIPYLMLKK